VGCNVLVQIQDRAKYFSDKLLPESFQPTLPPRAGAPEYNVIHIVCVQWNIQTWDECYYGTKWMWKNHVRRVSLSNLLLLQYTTNVSN